MEIQIGFDLDALEKQIIEFADKELISRMRGQVSHAFSVRNSWGAEDGPATLRITQLVNAYLDSPEFEQKIQETIKRSIDGVADKAVCKLLEAAVQLRVPESAPGKDKDA